MKVFDFSKRELTEMPLISENSIEYILDNNSITQIETISCQKFQCQIIKYQILIKN